ncbi:EYA2 [Lepeophtheirus salmonis]|uniref:Eyes absent homolog n=1 Tax=Lepeophtheirus salmonis TaxID=72036 RepID=A0A7R8H1Y4_LEPSM|nr:EYA2 [Lepeophtheirus salmonis]CAF2818142.1 EYA2 [Lepeophtheirus salmonis]
MYVTSGSGVRGGVEWMRKLSFRFRKIKEGFNLYRNNMGELLGSPKHENWFNIIEELELQTNGWYTSKVGKNACFDRITQRFGKKNITYVVIGDGKDEEGAAKKFKLSLLENN